MKERKRDRERKKAGLDVIQYVYLYNIHISDITD